MDEYRQASPSRTRRRAAVLILALCLLTVACSGAVGPASTPAEETPGSGPTATSSQPPRPSAGELPTEHATESPGSPTPAPPAALPQDPWRTAELRDVRSGEMLTINELAGRLVVVEPMAIWCSNCRAQQNEARSALASLGRSDLVYISLDVDPNETEPDLARYADERDYPWHFVVASREVARSLAQTFGDQVLSPPSTPKIVISPDGQAEVSFGIKRAAELEADFAALLP